MGSECSSGRHCMPCPELCTSGIQITCRLILLQLTVPWGAGWGLEGDSGRKEKVMGKNLKEGDHFVHRQQVDTFLYPHLLRNSELFHAASVEETEIFYSAFHCSALTG